MKKDWNHLFPGQKDNYLRRAHWLIDKEYVRDISAATLAKNIYENEIVDNDQVMKYSKNESDV